MSLVKISQRKGKSLIVMMGSRSVTLILFIAITLVQIIPAVVATACYHGTLLQGQCVCDQYYEGSDCSIYNMEITIPFEANSSISQSFWKYYHFAVNPSWQTFTVKLNQLSSDGDVDLYISNDGYPSASNYIDYDDSTSVAIVLTEDIDPSVQTYYIGIYGFTPCNYTLAVTITYGCENNCSKHGVCNLIDITCSCYAPYTGSDCSIYDLSLGFGAPVRGVIGHQEWLYYHFTLEEDADFTLNLTRTDSSTQIGCFLKEDQRPSLTQFNYANISNADTIIITVQKFTAGFWEIGLYGYVEGAFMLTIDFDIPQIQCSNDCSHKGDCVDGECECTDDYVGEYCQLYGNDIDMSELYEGYVSTSYWNYYPLQIVTSQAINVHFTQMSSEGNCDIYIRSGLFPTRVVFALSDTSSAPTADLVIQYPSSDTWYIGIYGFETCSYSISFSFIEICSCPEGAMGHCESGSTYCVCDEGWAGAGCDIQAQQISALSVFYSSVWKNQNKYYYVNVNSSALVITMIEKNTKGFIWLLSGDDGYPTIDDHDYIDYGYAGEMRFHEIRYLWNSKKQRTIYISVLGSSLDVSSSAVEFGITAYYTPF